MRRTVLSASFLVGAATLLSGCGQSESAVATSSSQRQASTSSASSSTSEQSSPASSAAAPTLSAGDVYACQKFVEDEDGAAAWLTRLVRDGTIPSGDTEAFVQKTQAYNMGGMASLTLPRVTSEALRAPMQQLADGQDQLRAEIDGGSVSPRPPLEALTAAAQACESGGFDISWYPLT